MSCQTATMKRYQILIKPVHLCFLFVSANSFSALIYSTCPCCGFVSTLPSRGVKENNVCSHRSCFTSLASGRNPLRVSVFLKCGAFAMDLMRVYAQWCPQICFVCVIFPFHFLHLMPARIANAPLCSALS